MKDKIRSLLGIEMSLGQREFKPLLLIFGVLLFLFMIIPITLSLVYLYIKNTLIVSWNEIRKGNKNNRYNGIKGV